MSRIGYARISSKQQCLVGQTRQLEEAGCDFIFSEQASGFTLNRPELKACLASLRPGDSLVIAHRDRLSRDPENLNKVLTDLKAKAIGVEVLSMNPTTEAIVENLTQDILSAFVALDSALRKDRQRIGIARAKARGKSLGRRPRLNPEVIQMMLKTGFGCLVR